MIGALSIIRFRTPVRSSYELIIYFLLLTVGIAAKADMFVSLLLTIVSVSIIYFLNKFYKNTGYKNNLSKKTLLIEMLFKDEIPDEILQNPNIDSINVKKNTNQNIVNCNLNIEENKEIEVFLKRWKDSILSYEIYN